MAKAHVSVATKSGIITESRFSGYDACINSYVGCEFGCTYCYVRAFVKDEDHEWGEFVRVRDHLADKLPKELARNEVKLSNGTKRVTTLDDNGNVIQKSVKQYKKIPISQARLVLGTMTDPYQPVERKYRITRKALEIIANKQYPQFAKVGIFTRSPIVLDDLDLITKLPKARVHFTVTPFPPKILRAIEPYSPITERRWQVVKELKNAGLRVHCNISPVIPKMSEQFVAEFVEKLTELQIDEYFVDPMQPYKESFASFKQACQDSTDISWHDIEQTMTNKEKYLEWKEEFHQAWEKERAKHQHKAPNQLPIWCDHENKVWVNMLTGEQMNSRLYGSDLA